MGLFKILILLFFLAMNFVFMACAHKSTNQQLVGRMFIEGLNAKNFEQVKSDAENGRIGGVIVFASAFANPEILKDKIAALRKASSQKLIFAIDGEGGRVLRLPGIKVANAFEMGQGGDKFTAIEAEKISRTLQDYGIDLNLAPVVDLAICENNPITLQQRSFFNSSDVVVERAKVFIKAHEIKGLKTTLKHFPGHGSSTHDTHHDWVDISATWTKSELEPYVKIFANGYNGAVMVGHLYNSEIDPLYPATLSKLTVTNLLRHEMGFRGVVITDDLQMGAIAKSYGLKQAVKLAIEAGNDFLLLAQQFRNDDLAEVQQWLIEQIELGNIDRSLLEKSVLRLQAL